MRPQPRHPVVDGRLGLLVELDDVEVIVAGEVAGGRERGAPAARRHPQPDRAQQRLSPGGQLVTHGSLRRDAASPYLAPDQAGCVLILRSVPPMLSTSSFVSCR